jgi:Ca-activated chloride channel family protein
MFVTQYTSFLAAPRSLLRPRAMKAGDPILRVKTVAGINAVVAHFPFGLTKPLHYSPEEDVWETRFLAPASMSDGRYHVDLYLTDEDGTVYSEQKEFTVDSKPPSLKLELESGKWRPGQTMELKIYADADTRSIVVRVGGLMPVSARWDDAAKANVARISLPADMPAGLHHIKISAVDFARNTAVLTEDVIVEEQ